MIFYIGMKKDGAYMYPEDVKVSYAAITYIKKLCERHLFTYEGYISSVKKVLKLNKKIPILISQNIILFQTKSVRSFDNVWINFCSIDYVRANGNKIIIKFIDGSEKNIEMSYFSYKRIVTTIFNIFKYKESLV